MMEASDFTGYTVTALKGICRNKGIKGYSKLNRAGLIELLIQAWHTQNDVEIGDTVVWHDSATGTAVYGVVSNTAAWGISVRIPFWDHVQGMLYSEYSKVTDARIIERTMDDFHSQAMIENIRREEQVTDEEINSTEIPVQPSTPFFPEGDARNFDSVNALKVMINALTPLADAALAACEATPTGPVRDLHYQAYLDMSRAADEMRRTLMFFDE